MFRSTISPRRHPSRRREGPTVTLRSDEKITVPYPKLKEKEISTSLEGSQRSIPPVSRSVGPVDRPFYGYTEESSTGDSNFQGRRSSFFGFDGLSVPDSPVFKDRTTPQLSIHGISVLGSCSDMTSGCPSSIEPSPEGIRATAVVKDSSQPSQKEHDLSPQVSLFGSQNSSKGHEDINQLCDISQLAPVIPLASADEPCPSVLSWKPVESPLSLVTAPFSACEITSDPGKLAVASNTIHDSGLPKKNQPSFSRRRKSFRSQSESVVLSPKPISLVHQLRLKDSLLKLTKMPPMGPRWISHSIRPIQAEEQSKRSLADSFPSIEVHSSSRTPSQESQPIHSEQDVYTRHVIHPPVEIIAQVGDIPLMSGSSPSAVLRKFKLKKRDSSGLDPIWSSRSTFQATDRVGGSKEPWSHNIKYRGNSLPGEGTVRINRSQRAIVTSTDWHKSCHQDLFTTPSALKDTVRRATEHGERQNIELDTNRRLRHGACRLSPGNLLEANSDCQGKELAKSSHPSMSSIDRGDAPEVQSFFSESSGGNHDNNISGKGLLSLRSWMLVIFTNQKSRKNKRQGETGSDVRHDGVYVPQSGDMSEPMENHTPSRGQLFAKYKRRAGDLKCSVSRWAKGAKLAITSRGGRE